MMNSRAYKMPVPVLRCSGGALLFSLFLWSFFLSSEPLLSHAADSPKVRHDEVALTDDNPPYVPVYRIPLRVHVAASHHSAAHLNEILTEINSIWWLQAAICFEIEAVHHDRPLDSGADIWLMPVLKDNAAYNGYYSGDHKIYVRDTPILKSASRPARSPAARTAAHELGHVLGLRHRQDSDDNLMRSKTFGWQLNASEIQHARAVAARKALPDKNPLRCGTPQFDY